jgi:hypothetical protein
MRRQPSRVLPPLDIPVGMEPLMISAFEHLRQ